MSYGERFFFFITTLEAMISCITDITLQLPGGHSLKQSKFYFLTFIFPVLFRVTCVAMLPIGKMERSSCFCRQSQGFCPHYTNIEFI